VIDSKTTTSIELEGANLVELQRELIGVYVNTFLVKRDC
jgi:hypothetical protein